jgi:hypothetical protein
MWGRSIPKKEFRFQTSEEVKTGKSFPCTSKAGKEAIRKKPVA